MPWNCRAVTQPLHSTALPASTMALAAATALRNSTGGGSIAGRLCKRVAVQVDLQVAAARDAGKEAGAGKGGPRVRRRRGAIYGGGDDRSGGLPSCTLLGLHWKLTCYLLFNIKWSESQSTSPVKTADSISVAPALQLRNPAISKLT